MSETTFYVYEHWRPDRGECFYVGKGRGNRASAMRGRNGRHKAIQLKLSRMGLRVEVRFVATGLTEAESFDLERERIAFWRNDGASLANMTEGGEGTAGLVQSAEVVAKRVKANTGQKRNEETRERMRAAAAIRNESEEYRAKLSASKKGRTFSDEHKRGLSASWTDERKAKYRAKRLGTKPPQESIEKMRKALTGRKLSEEHKSTLRAAQKLRREKEKLAKNIVLSNIETQTFKVKVK